MMRCVTLSIALLVVGVSSTGVKKRLGGQARFTDTFSLLAKLNSDPYALNQALSASKPVSLSQAHSGASVAEVAGFGGLAGLGVTEATTVGSDAAADAVSDSIKDLFNLPDASAKAPAAPAAKKVKAASVVKTPAPAAKKVAAAVVAPAPKKAAAAPKAKVVPPAPKAKAKAQKAPETPKKAVVVAAKAKVAPKAPAAPKVAPKPVAVAPKAKVAAPKPAVVPKKVATKPAAPAPKAAAKVVLARAKAAPAPKAVKPIAAAPKKQAPKAAVVAPKPKAAKLAAISKVSQTDVSREAALEAEVAALKAKIASAPVAKPAAPVAKPAAPVAKPAAKAAPVKPAAAPVAKKAATGGSLAMAAFSAGASRSQASDETDDFEGNFEAPPAAPAAKVQAKPATPVVEAPKPVAAVPAAPTAAPAAVLTMTMVPPAGSPDVPHNSIITEAVSSPQPFSLFGSVGTFFHNMFFGAPPPAPVPTMAPVADPNAGRPSFSKQDIDRTSDSAHDDGLSDVAISDEFSRKESEDIELIDRVKREDRALRIDAQTPKRPSMPAPANFQHEAGSTHISSFWGTLADEDADIEQALAQDGDDLTEYERLKKLQDAKVVESVSEINSPMGDRLALERTALRRKAAAAAA